ncbi:MAG: hypothetical protein KDB07_06310 [Planctomycetes bacterium]|nr:hypothetical protein [Planctomycetota bacterium]
MKYLAIVLVLIATGLVSACSSGQRRKALLDLPKDVPVYVAPVKNLSGAPLTKLDPDIYTADNLEHQKKLSGGKSLSLPELTRRAFEVTLREEGFLVSDDPKSRYQVHVSISEWSGESIQSDGQVWLGLNGFLVDTSFPDEPVAEAASKRFHQLLSGNPDESGVLGAMRLVSGSYERMILDATFDLLINAGVIAPLQDIDGPATSEAAK